MTEMETAQWDLPPEVLYFPDTQTLVIENGKRRTEGERIAKGVTVFYGAAQGEPGECEVSGITIDFAEHLLKPFVDAILAKHGVMPEQPDASESKGGVSKPR